MKQDDLDSFLPLSQAVLSILLALVDQDRHGYGIMLEVERQSGGRYKLGPGTLYDNLEKLMNDSLVEETPRPVSADDRRRQYYRLSDLGRRVLSAEVSRIEALFHGLKPRLRAARGV